MPGGRAKSTSAAASSTAERVDGRKTTAAAAAEALQTALQYQAAMLMDLLLRSAAASLTAERVDGRKQTALRCGARPHPPRIDSVPFSASIATAAAPVRSVAGATAAGIAASVACLFLGLLARPPSPACAGRGGAARRLSPSRRRRCRDRLLVSQPPLARAGRPRGRGRHPPPASLPWSPGSFLGAVVVWAQAAWPPSRAAG